MDKKIIASIAASILLTAGIFTLLPKNSNDPVIKNSKANGIDVRVDTRIRFSQVTDKGTYSDALYYTQEEFNNLTEDQLVKAMTDRVNTWKYNIENPPAQIEPTKEKLQQQYDELQDQADEIKKQIDEID